MLRVINLLIVLRYIYNNAHLYLPYDLKEKWKRVSFPNACVTILHISLALFFIVAERDLLLKVNCTTDTLIHRDRNYFFFLFKPMDLTLLPPGASTIDTFATAVPKNSLSPHSCN
jgi:hypothetical protein